MATHILIGTDADHIAQDVMSALGGSETSFTIVSNGRSVTAAVERRTPDLAVLDLQIGSMGAMAVTMGLRLDESAGALPHVKVLMLLDRRADVHLAKRCGAEAWLIKPLDPLTIKRTARAVLAGPPATDEDAQDVVHVAADAAPRRWRRARPEPAAAG